MIEYDNFRKSLKNLESRNEYRKNKTQYPDKDTEESVTESVIQRFEICYDCLWKVLKHYLEEIEGRVDVPSSPRGVFRVAAEAQVLDTSVEQWFKYINARIGTTHDYDGEKAQKAIDIIDEFINDSTKLYQKMTGAEWK